jgi:hypothetical protein
LEELLPKDHESIHLSIDGPLAPSEPAGFSADQMIRCDECLRANPPTRVNCLYCAAALPVTESTARLRKPTLKQPDKHEPGFNTIALCSTQPPQTADSLNEIAELLKLSIENCQRILEAEIPLPLARTASRDEADLVVERLAELGLSTVTLSDETLGTEEASVVRARSLQWDEEQLWIHLSGGKDSCLVNWSDLFLLVSGRLTLKKVEVVERMSKRSEKELLDTSQFFNDETIIDLYASSVDQTFRIGANSFDFSCLGEDKTLVSVQNLKTLRDAIISRSTNIKVDESYNVLRNALEPVWPIEQETESRGWRRERPGKYRLGATTVDSNEAQFTRYSRLRRYFILNPLS